MPSTSVDKASTNPGQYSTLRSRRARASAMTYLLLLVEHDLFRKPVPTFRDHALNLVVLTSEPFEQALDVLLLLRLRVGPIADHLLFGAHVIDEAVDGLGEIRHRG